MRRTCPPHLHRPQAHRPFPPRLWPFCGAVGLLCQVVHIDFGIVFEQGRTLSTPETVPFRLTRDLVDGLGITGVEGLFRRSCERTLACLRRPGNAAALATLAEVFIHDPLYKWLLNPLQATHHQRIATAADNAAAAEGNGDGAGGAEEAEEAGLAHTSVAAAASAAAAAAAAGAAGGDNATGMREAAERTLARIRQKLQGYEDPNDSALSVEGQVGLLISQATSEENLHKIFAGWAPWL